MSEIDFHSQDKVAETLIIPLYFRAKESQRPDALIRDAKAVELVERIDYDFSRIKFQDHDQVGTVMRNREFDRLVRDFLPRSPGAVVVHIGCGLGTRFERVDDGEVEWFDLDLPEVIALRRRLIGEAAEGSHLLGCSVFEYGWMDALSEMNGRPFLFIAEGVFPYFPEAQVKRLVLALKERFPGAELVCDGMTPFFTWLHNVQLVFSKFNARLHWGLKRGRDLETWGEDIRLLEEWFYFDRPEPRMGSSNWMRRFPLLAKSVGIFHYRLGQRQASG